VAGVVPDTSVLLEYFERRPIEMLEEAFDDGTLTVPPLVVAEVISGDLTPAQRIAFGELLQDAPLHVTSLRHWMDVGHLRRQLRRKGVTVTLPDAHVAQCALELDALLLTRDAIFTQIAQHTSLRVTSAKA
jgi:predicted nucleic acid-binding protein